MSNHSLFVDGNTITFKIYDFENISEQASIEDISAASQELEDALSSIKPGETLDIIIDMSESNGAGKYPKSSRKIHEKFMNDDRVGKIAIVSRQKRVQLIVNFFASLYKNSEKVKAFTNTNDAIMWFRE